MEDDVPAVNVFGNFEVPAVNQLHPHRLTWNIIIEVWKIIFLPKWLICRFHVNLPGCNFTLGLCVDPLFSDV